LGSLKDGKICCLRIYIFKVQSLIENYNVIFKKNDGLQRVFPHWYFSLTLKRLLTLDMQAGGSI